MPIDWLTLLAAAGAGMLGGLHCAAMCGGIATGLSSVGGGGLAAAVQANLGRVTGYAVAGGIAGGVGHGIVDIARMDWLGPTLRLLLGAVMVGSLERSWIAYGFLGDERERPCRVLPARPPKDCLQARARRARAGVLGQRVRFPCG